MTDHQQRLREAVEHARQRLRRQPPCCVDAGGECPQHRQVQAAADRQAAARRGRARRDDRSRS